MSADGAAALAGQREALREQLRLQRQVLGRELVPATGGYPRSITMRWLIREPELVGTLVGKVAGRRAATAIPAVFLAVRWLSAVVPR